MVEIEWKGIRAYADNYSWKSDDANFLRLLNTLIDEDGPMPDDPDPDYTLALEAVNQFGFRIVSWDGEPVETGVPVPKDDKTQSRTI